jgi:hypothetical protein
LNELHLKDKAIIHTAYSTGKLYKKSKIHEKAVDIMAPACASDGLPPGLIADWESSTCLCLMWGDVANQWHHLRA